MAGLRNLLAAMAIFALTLVGTVTADKSAGCGKTPTITSKQYTMTVNNKQRQYFMKMPDHYDSSHPYRLVFLWHELNSDAQKIVNGENPQQGGVTAYYGLPPLANNTAIFVVPNGINNGWGNAGGEDLMFFDQLVKVIEADLCVDTNQRFSTGFSYGAAMTYALACDRSKMIRAVAVISGGLLSGCSDGKNPVPYYGQHGTNDKVLNVSGGRSLRDRFVKNNGCTPLSSEPQPSQGKSVKTEYKGCKDGFPITWVIHTGDHNPSQTDSGSSTPFAPKNTWDFWAQFT